VGTRSVRNFMFLFPIILTTAIRRTIIIVSQVFLARLLHDDVHVVATKTPQETAPVLGRGALCADSMGLCVHLCFVYAEIHEFYRSSGGRH
jgi:hypothetical protein